MNKIKDFIYNKNDIIIVLLILAAAAFIIYDRMEAIMNYEAVPAVEQSEEATEPTDSTEATQETTESTDETQTTEATDEDTDSEDADSEDADKEYVTVRVSDSSTLSEVAEDLASKGLIDNADDFIKYAEDKGKSSAIITGTYKLSKDMSRSDILEAITK